jgi:hypothetical protein
MNDEGSEIVYSITKSMMDAIVKKLTELDELKVRDHPDVEQMRQEALETLTTGVSDLRRVFSKYLDSLWEV